MIPGYLSTLICDFGALFTLVRFGNKVVVIVAMSLSGNAYMGTNYITPIHYPT